MENPSMFLSELSTKPLRRLRLKYCGSRSITYLTLLFCMSYLACYLYSFHLCQTSVRNKFADYRDDYTETYHMVCLTNRNVKFTHYSYCEKEWYSKNRTIQFECRTCWHPQKLLTVYQECPRFPFLGTRQQVGLDITFARLSKVPKDYTIIRNQTAYFIGESLLPNEPTNFFHFTKQIFFPSYWLIKLTNQLKESAHNILFLPGPYGVCNSTHFRYHDLDTLKYFRDILYIKNKPDLSAFIESPYPNKVCYENAVFSTNLFLGKASQAISYFKNTIGVHDYACETGILTIINRSNYRRILATDILKKVGEELGYKTRIVYMEKLSLKEQAQLIHCTNVLVGVAGAGLQWAYFMKNRSAVIEIAWPDKEWHFFFSSKTTYQSGQMDVIIPLKFVQLRGECVFNPPAVNAYAKELFKKDLNLSYEESMEILHDERNYGYFRKPVRSVGKLCDVKILKESFLKALLQARESTS